MANEIKPTFGITYANGNIKSTIPFEQMNITQSAAKRLGKTVTVAQAAEADLDTTGITTLGWAYIRNNGPTNYLKYGPKSGGVMVEFGRLKTGEACWFRLAPGITLRWVADTADVTANVELFND